VVDLDGILRTSMACPALPTCGLAVTESERSLPDINRRLRALMTGLGFDEGESFVVRMTGARLLSALSRAAAGCTYCLWCCKLQRMP
jgi:hypothetical protein